jgi:hypothetical protein
MQAACAQHHMAVLPHHLLLARLALQGSSCVLIAPVQTHLLSVWQPMEAFPPSSATSALQASLHALTAPVQTVLLSVWQRMVGHLQLQATALAVALAAQLASMYALMERAPTRWPSA